MTTPDDDLMRRLAEIVDNAPDGRKTMPDHVPCLFTMGLADGRLSAWCRIDAGTPHSIHVSSNGVCRWNDDGIALETPMWGTAAFRQLYENDPTGQTLYRPEDGPSRPNTSGVAMSDPPPGLTGFSAIRWRWNAYAALPVTYRRLRRVGLLAGFVVGLVITVAAIAAVVLSILALVWFAVAYFARWLA